MPVLHKVQTVDFFNAYRIANNQCTSITLYSSNGPILTHDCGWFGSNRVSIPAIENLDLYSKRKVDYNIMTGFFIGEALYIHIASFASIDVEHDVFNYSTPTKVVTVSKVILDGTAFTLAGSTIVTLTELGDKVTKLRSFLKDISINVCDDEALQLIKNAELLKEHL